MKIELDLDDDRVDDVVRGWLRWVVIISEKDHKYGEDQDFWNEMALHSKELLRLNWHESD